MANIDNTLLISRIPIILADMAAKAGIQEKELVFDYANNDIYVRRNGEMVSITKILRETITDIKDGSAVIHIVTEDTLPPIKDRPKNHWYIVVTSLRDADGDKIEEFSTYVYYGAVKMEMDDVSPDLVLIAQNMIKNTDTVKMNLPDGYKACFYVPVKYNPKFYKDSVELETVVIKRLYVLTPDNVSLPYDVYVTTAGAFGECNIRIDLNGGATHTADEEMGTDVERK